ncbi:MAG: hypothetical protein Ct9H300mP28_03600 [Pseudomonadota bacterium]|nr:MAG: hypothetical protein Ct9H300mP28_03600 [Pseudomonadota bacterium]
MFFIRFVRTIFVALSILVLSTTGSYSQEEEPPAPAEAPGAVWRIGFGKFCIKPSTVMRTTRFIK